MSMTMSLIKQHRVAVIPEYDGQWHAEYYGDSEKPQTTGQGSTPDEAVRDALKKAGKF